MIYLAGDSWLDASINIDANALLSNLTNTIVVDVAVGGYTSADVLHQLNTAIANGGTFQPETTVIINVGGNDFLRQIPRAETKNNIDQIISILNTFNVQTIISGAPNIDSVNDILNGNLHLDQIYTQFGSNVVVVDAMSILLSIPQLRSADNIHLTSAGFTVFNFALSNAYNITHGADYFHFSDIDVINFINGNHLTFSQAKSVTDLLHVDLIGVMERNTCYIDFQ